LEFSHPRLITDAELEVLIVVIVCPVERASMASSHHTCQIDFFHKQTSTGRYNEKFPRVDTLVSSNFLVALLPLPLLLLPLSPNHAFLMAITMASALLNVIIYS
jgi:hypothetical protein